MSSYNRIHNLVNQIKMQKECLEDLKKIKEEGKVTKLDPDQAAGEISKDLEKNISKIQISHKEYDQYMLTRMMRKGLTDDDMIAWWMNRY